MAVDMGEIQRTAHRRLNVGCGQFPLTFWRNLDADPLVDADIHADALEYLSVCFEGEYDEIYVGHFLEHLNQSDAHLFVDECYRVLAPGGKLGIVVPDTEQIMHRYLRRSVDAIEYPEGEWWPIADLDAVCALFLYSTVQDTPHRWMYDKPSLSRLLANAGFIGLRDIDRYRDPRLASGAWYQFGLDGWKAK